ncbi:MAG: protein-glutamate O-methyltransferase [Terriglobia bacterium]
MISNADFGRLRRLIYEQAGINLSPDKKTMLELRIKRRLRSLNLNSYAQYCDYLFARHGQKEEIVHLIDVVTTNKTDFFREAAHFDLLVQKAIPDVMAGNESGRQLLVWSAACSSGEEPYTLAMVLNEYGQAHPGFRFRVLATDVSTTVLEKAKLGVYSYEVVRPVSPDLRRKYFMRSRDPDSKVLRVVPELRQLVEFRRLNFMDADFGLSERADIIFCRNVLIYFDRPTQEKILQKLTRHLAPRGYTFVGHAETLHDMDVPLAPVAPALYRKIDARN